MRVGNISTKFPCAEWLPLGTACLSLPWLIVSPGTGALVLQKGEIRVINQTTCEGLLPQQITPRMMCVGFLSGGVDSCQVCGLAGKRPSWRRDLERLELGKGQAREGKGHAEGVGKEVALGKGREKRGLTRLELGKACAGESRSQEGKPRGRLGMGDPVWWRPLLRVWARASRRESVFT